MLFGAKSGTVFFMKWILTFVCLGMTVAQGKTMVVEAGLPATLPAALYDIKAPAPKDTGWSMAEAPQKVRQFLAEKNSDAEKIEVLSWWAARTERPDFLFDLAARCAKAEQTDAAIYWLQRAAREDVCAVAELSSDERFATVKKDERWSKLLDFLRACEAGWQETSFYRDVLTVPESYDGTSAIPLVIGLHGYGSLPEDFAGSDIQKICDVQNIAFLAVSGRRPLGRNSFMWTESFEKDGKHIDAAIERARPHLKVTRGRMVAIAFSQGGQLAAEITAAFPQHYRGCISMSPGSRFLDGLVGRLEKVPISLAGQQYFFSWISGEGPRPKQRVQSWRLVLEEQNATVYQYEFPGKGHNFPRNYEDYFSIALQVILRKTPK